MRNSNINIIEHEYTQFLPFHLNSLLLLGVYSCYGLVWINVRCPLQPPYHSPSSAGQGRENMMKGSWVKIRIRKYHSLITITDKID